MVLKNIFKISASYQPLDLFSKSRIYHELKKIIFNNKNINIKNHFIIEDFNIDLSINHIINKTFLNNFLENKLILCFSSNF